MNVKTEKETSENRVKAESRIKLLKGSLIFSDMKRLHW